MPTLYIIRGLPGSGKSTFSKSLLEAGVIWAWYEADMFMVNPDGDHEFDAQKLSYCHKMCQKVTEFSMKSGRNVGVSNTSTTEKELQPYLDLAEEYGYTVVSLIVENRHGNKSVHGVPDEKMQQMRQRFSVKI